MSDTIKPCPFCGGKAKVLRNIYNNYIVTCSKCYISTLQQGKKAEAINDWNTRKPIDRILEKLEEKRNYHYTQYRILDFETDATAASAYGTAIGIVKGETE